MGCPKNDTKHKKELPLSREILRVHELRSIVQRATHTPQLRVKDACTSEWMCLDPWEKEPLHSQGAACAALRHDDAWLAQLPTRRTNHRPMSPVSHVLAATFLHLAVSRQKRLPSENEHESDRATNGQAQTKTPRTYVRAHDVVAQVEAGSLAACAEEDLVPYLASLCAEKHHYTSDSGCAQQPK